MKQLIFIILLIPIALFSQSKETISQNRADYVGIKTKKDFKKGSHIKWFNESYNGHRK